jgi:hypothetical protein
MTEDIESFAERVGKEISSKIIAKYDDADYTFETQSVQEDIFEQSFSEAKNFFQEHALTEEATDILKSHLNTRVVPGTNLIGLARETLLAEVIKTYVIDALFEQNIVLD